MENVSDLLGARIREYRKKVGLTQEALALNSGINVSFLGDIERGNKKPSIESLEKLLKTLGVTFQEFFDFEIAIKPFKDCASVEKLNMELKGRPEDEVEMVYDVIQKILEFTAALTHAFRSFNNLLVLDYYTLAFIVYLQCALAQMVNPDISWDS